MSLPDTRDRFDTCPHCGAIKGRDERPLTRQQAKLYAYIEAYSRQHGYAPSFAEMAEQFRYRSLATVHEHLTNLEFKGWVKRRYNEARALECLVRLEDL